MKGIYLYGWGVLLNMCYSFWLAPSVVNGQDLVNVDAVGGYPQGDGAGALLKVLFCLAEPPQAGQNLSHTTPGGVCTGDDSDHIGGGVGRHLDRLSAPTPGLDHEGVHKWGRNRHHRHRTVSENTKKL